MFILSHSAVMPTHSLHPDPTCLSRAAAGYVAQKIKGMMPVGTVLHFVQKNVIDVRLSAILSQVHGQIIAHTFLTKDRETKDQKLLCLSLSCLEKEKRTRFFSVVVPGLSKGVATLAPTSPNTNKLGGSYPVIHPLGMTSETRVKLLKLPVTCDS